MKAQNRPIAPRVCGHKVSQGPAQSEPGASFAKGKHSYLPASEGKHSPLPLRGLPWVRVVTGSVPGMFTQSRRSVAS